MPSNNNGTSGRTLPVFESLPPSWLPKVSNSADLGYLGFHPPRPGQDEDLLSESSVKNGFTLDSQVSAETFSAQSILNIEDAALSRLESLMNEVFVRRADAIPHVPSSSFRIPTRVTLNDSKRQAWFADLANPDVPLYKLGKSVPHGAKGHDLLDLLQSNNVAISRAVWFLRVFGANETAGLRNKPFYNPIQYSIDWANVVTSYMKKQLADIALPSAPRPGLNIKQTFKGVLSDADTRDRWISRFTYCLKLLRTFYAEGLVDNRTLLVWIVQQHGNCNLAQIGFITRLADEYLEGIVGCRALARPFIDSCLSKLSEIRATSAQEFLHDTEQLLQTLLQRLCIVMPDFFVSPRTWRVYSILITNVLNGKVTESFGDKYMKQNYQDICQVLQGNLSDIRRRNEAMLFQNLSTQQTPQLGSVIMDVKLLNSISSATDMNTVKFFSHADDIKSGFLEKLDKLLTWCVTPLQYGDHRPFAAVTLISNWRTRVQERAARRDFHPPDEFLQDRLFDWLDSSDVAGDPDNIRSVALLFGKLVKHELFSYANYIQRLIARGEAGLSFLEEHIESHHRRFLRWIPLFGSTSSLISQRKVTLYGARSRETPEDLNERAIRREIRAVLPALFGGDTELTNSSSPLSQCNVLLTSPHFEQVRTLRHWLLPLLQKYIPSQGPETNQALLLTTYSTSIELMDHTKCYHSVLDLTLSLLERSGSLELLNAVINTLHRFATIWACMNVVANIIMALDIAHQVWKARGIQFRPLLSLLLEFDNGKHLSMASRDRITADITAFTLALQPATERPDVVPDVLPEILLLAGDPDGDAPSLLANTLWIKYRKSLDWAWKVWDNTVASLRQVPAMISDITGRRACALRYGSFLCHIDQHLAMGLDTEVSRWLLGPGKNEITALSSDVWDVLTILLLHLSVHGALKTTTILRGLVYPAWQQAANISTDYHDHNLERFLLSANELCRRLLLSEDINHDELPPTDLLQLQSIRTRRQDVYLAPHFPLLASSVPLLICVENNDRIPEGLRKDSTSLRHLLSLNSDFRQGAYRNLDAIREAFEQALYPPTQQAGDMNKRIIGGLRMLLSDISDDTELSDWPAVTSLLGPWKIAATVIQVQLTLKLIGQGNRHDSNDHMANVNLDKLILMLFHPSITSEEAFYVGEMVRGADVAVVGKFINNGLKCITEVIRKSSSEYFRRASELLRVLIYMAEPLRSHVSPLLVLEHSVQDDLFDVLCLHITPFEFLVASNDDKSQNHADLTGEILLLLRLLQFALGFQSVWSSKAINIANKLSSSLFKLALTYGTTHILDPVTYPLIIDTLYYVYDEIPPDSKSITYDPFRNYPDLPISELSFDLPMEYRQQLRSLLSHLPVTVIVSNLVNSYWDPTGGIIHGTPVINRPWEWIENLGEPTTSDRKEDRERDEKEIKAQYLVKNSGSLSLDMFGAHMTGNGVLRGAGQDDDSSLEGNLRAFEDGLSAENIFKRDWRETRVGVDVITGAQAGNQRKETESDGAGFFFQYGSSRFDRRPTPRDSPSSSITSRTSARGSTVSGLQSPGQDSSNRQSNSTISENVELVNVITGSSSNRPFIDKRKATALSAESDGEVEMVEGQVSTRAGTSKKPKIKGPTKARSKKK